MAYDLSAHEAYFKEFYTRQRQENLAYKSFKWYGIVPKFETFQGDVMPIPLTYANAGSPSVSFTKAKANFGSAQNAAFQISLKQKYNYFEIDNLTIETSKGNGAFTPALLHQPNSALKKTVRAIALDLWGDGTGERGTIGSVTTTAITLSNAADSVKFELGDHIVASDTTHATLKKSGTSFEITAINRITGVLTVESSVTTGTAWAAGDSLFIDGEHGTSSTTLNVCAGVSGWIPYSDPGGSDDWFGVNRSTDRVRLAGVPFDGSNLSIQEGLLELGSLLERESHGTPDVVFMNQDAFVQLQKELLGQATYEMMQGSTKAAAINYRGLCMFVGGSEVKVMPDRDVPSGYAWVLDSSTWGLQSVGMAPHFYAGDGGRYLRLSSSDGIEGRVRAYYQLWCNYPGANGVLKLPS